MRYRLLFSLLVLLLAACDKQPEEPPAPLTIEALEVDGLTASNNEYRPTHLKPEIKIVFSQPVDPDLVKGLVVWKQGSDFVAFETHSTGDDKVFTLKPVENLRHLEVNQVTVPGMIAAKNGSYLDASKTITLFTPVDPADKFPRIPAEDLLTLVQRTTFTYFWENGHPVSGMARERNSSGNLVTTGGSGFGLMSIIVAMERKFITETEGITRIKQIVNFLRSADRFHGAFPHWLDGTTGKTMKFSAKDDGADLVETALLFQGLLTVREYLNEKQLEPATVALITQLWEEVEWTWFQKNGENVLYWHWSPNYGWDMNHKITGWNEALIVYVLAASSPTHAIDKKVYTEGWAQNGKIQNGNSYFGITLPLGPTSGGPLFLSQYSFLGLDPRNLQDQYANYWEQCVAHARIHYAYCATNPRNYAGYSEHCWGLSACDTKFEYTACSPTNDVGHIAPTAAISSIPFMPGEAMGALQYYYYTLGDKIWKTNGFSDAFSIHHVWFANSHLAIDQGPQIIMIENFRTQLLWDLFMKSPEVKNGLTKLGFTY